MALIGSINEQGELQGQINGARYLTGVITSASAVGGEIVGMRGLKGDKGDQGDTGATGADGQDGADGFSPSASVSKVGDTTTITITDKDGTTTASVYDGKEDVFVAEYGESSFTEVEDAIIEGKQIYLSKTAAGYSNYYPVSVVQSGGSQLDLFYISRTGLSPASTSVLYHASVTSSDVWSFEDYPLQPKLVSGTNIKTINNESLLGSGNIDIQSGGASAFIAEYGVTSYADVKDAYDEDAIILCTVDDSGNTVICHLAYYDDENDGFYFSQPQSEGAYWAGILSDDTWVDGYFQFASTDTATELRNGLMDALDKQKLDGIASGAEVNVQSDWNEADSTADDFIKNKPTIPSKTSDLNNDSGFITGGTSTPTADEVAEFDSDAHMNSTDMTAVQVDDFVDGLNVSSAGFPFAIEWKTLDFGSCRNQTDYTQTLDISKDGYNGWGIISWEIRGTWKTHFTIATMKINNWATLSCSIRSTNATSFTTDHTYVDVLVLYKRTT